MQVDWSKAPEWANWHAFDKNGDGYWYAGEPYQNGVYFSSLHRVKWSRNQDPTVSGNWEQSKVKRPHQHTNSNQTAAVKPKHPHYHKPTNGVETVDVYWVLNNWGVECHAIGHAVKKLLNAGQRGVKTTEQDLTEAIDSIKRAIELL